MRSLLSSCSDLLACGRMPLLACALWGLSAPRVTHAQNRGFQINRYEPTAAGEWSFWVDHPWYSRTRYFAAGVTLDYAHNPLIAGLIRPDGSLTQTQSVIEHGLTGHIDLAGSFLDRILVTATLPITFVESGQTSTLTSVRAASGPYLSDPRLGAWVRLYGQPYGNAFSLSVGGQLWIPLRGFVDELPEQASDQQARGLLRVAIGGLKHHILWSATAGMLFRPEARLGDVADTTGRTASSELQLGGALAYASTEHRFAIGPEVVLASRTSSLFQQYATSLDVLASGHYNLARMIHVGVAGGLGLLRQSGTADARVMLRLAYAPLAKPEPKDRDKDGVIDANDRCPDEPQGSRPDPEQAGCPERDSDHDSVFDSEDLCRDEAQGDNPDPNRKGCPAYDKDGDGVFDFEDLCIDESKGANPDPSKMGCPARDKDGDGVFDYQDQCPEVARGEHPDPAKTGCPAGDRDRDGVFDPDDQCIDVPAGVLPDPAKRGCPLSDRDRDYIPDGADACPEQPGAPSPDPTKNGCPSKLLEVRSDQIVIKQQIFFDTKKDTIQKKSFPLLSALADALRAVPQIKKVRVEGHTDNVGKPDFNLDLSKRRAQSVQRWLIEHGIDPSRLESEGYGMDRPIVDNKTKAGQAKNRRVDFIIIDPPQEPASASPMQAPVAPQAQVAPAPAPAPGPASASTAGQGPSAAVGKKGKWVKGSLADAPKGTAAPAAKPSPSSPPAKPAKPAAGTAAPAGPAAAGKSAKAAKTPASKPTPAK